MARGFVAGAMIGAVVCAIAAGALSIAVGPPVAVSGKGAKPAPGQGGPVDAPAPDAIPETARQTNAAPALPSEPVVAAPTGGQELPSEPAPLSQTASPPGTAAPSEPTVDARADGAGPGLDIAAPSVDSAGPDTPSAPAPESAANAPTVTAPANAERDSGAPAPAAPRDEPAPDLATTAPAPLPEAPVAETRKADLPTIGAQQAGETDTAPNDRPSIGAPAASLLSRTDAEPASDAQPEAAPDDLPPLERYAATLSAPTDGPMMSVVLIDDGRSPLGPDSVGDLPFAVSFAISPSHPDAAAAARAYRAAGFEVLALAGVPEGAQASDAEINLEGALGAVPEAIGVLEDPAQGLQGSRDVSEQAAEFLRDSGHGLVMLPKGLGTAEALVRRIGVPSATVFRDFDGAAQTPRVMRRFLDQAAFRARQEGAVVMLGRLRADTISALVLWGLQDRASSVSLVPVSAVLERGGAPD